MRVKELIEELKKHDETEIVTVIKQHGKQYQEMYGIHYLNGSHPAGGVCIHLSRLAEESLTTPANSGN